MIWKMFVTLVLICLCTNAYSAGNEPEKYYSQGVELNKKGNFAEAIKLYSKAIALKPKTPELYYVRGRAYRDLGQLNAALADFTKAVELRPTYAEAYNHRGVVFIGMHDAQKALPDFTKACQLGYKDACINRDRLTNLKK